MKKYVCLIFILINQNLTGQHEDFITEYTIDIYSERISFFELINSIEILSLQESENSFLASIDDFFYVDDTKVAIINKSIKPPSILIFNEDGKFLNSITNFGQGPDEYRNISSAWSIDNQIQLYSSFSRNLHFYNSEGNYVKTKRLNYSKEFLGNSMQPLNDGYVINRADPSSPSTVVKYNQILFVDHELNPKRSAAYNNNPKPVPLGMGKILRKNRDSLFYHPPLQNTLFLINKQEVKPLYKFNFPDNWLWNDKDKLRAMNIATRAIANEGKVFEVLPIVGVKFIALSYFYNTQDNPKGLINRVTKKFTRIDVRKENGHDFNLKFVDWHKSELIISIETQELKEFVSKFDKTQIKIKGDISMDKILKNENPCLIFIKFIDDF